MKPSLSLLLYGLWGIVGADQSTRSFGICVTESGPARPPRIVPTIKFSETVKIPVLVVSTQEPTTTTTPAPVTSTTTVFSTSTSVTTLSQSTDTFSTTTTIFSTVTSTETDTITITDLESSTSTISGSTLTIPPSAGFTPISSALASAIGTGDAPSGKRKRDTLEGRDLRNSNPLPKGGGLNPPNSPKLYAEQVLCNTLYEIFSTSTLVVTGKKTLTITATPVTSVATSTSTVVSISTATLSDISTTESFSTTSIVSTQTQVTTTTTTTSTAVISVTLPSETVYGACLDDNFAAYYTSGDGFWDGLITYDASLTTVDSPYDCCVACVQAGALCGGTATTPLNNAYECYSFTTDSTTVCNADLQIGSAWWSPGSSSVYTFSNGNCGQFGFTEESE